MSINKLQTAQWPAYQYSEHPQLVSNSSSRGQPDWQTDGENYSRFISIFFITAACCTVVRQNIEYWSHISTEHCHSIFGTKCVFSLCHLHCMRNWMNIAALSAHFFTQPYTPIASSFIKLNRWCSSIRNHQQHNFGLNISTNEYVAVPVWTLDLVNSKIATAKCKPKRKAVPWTNYML